MSDFDMVMCYMVVGTVSAGFVAALRHAINLKHKDDAFGRQAGHGAYIKQGGCDVCGSATSLACCSDCEAWAEAQVMECEDRMAFRMLAPYADGLRGRMAELKRGRKAAGW
jgi:hypothetical protein